MAFATLSSERRRRTEGFVVGMGEDVEQCGHMQRENAERRTNEVGRGQPRGKGPHNTNQGTHEQRIRFPGYLRAVRKQRRRPLFIGRRRGIQQNGGIAEPLLRRGERSRLILFSDDPLKGRLPRSEHAAHVRMAETAVFAELNVLLHVLHRRRTGFFCHGLQIGKPFLEAVTAIDLHGEAEGLVGENGVRNQSTAYSARSRCASGQFPPGSYRWRHRRARGR